MSQLSGLDAAFVHQESPATPMHVSPVLVYAPNPSTGQSLNLECLQTIFTQAIASIPFLTQKLKIVPLGMDEPYWRKDRDFDIDHHLSEQALPAPGDWSQLKHTLARLHADGLDMKRPLWHATLITGLDAIEDLPEDSAALMVKIHHAGIDGVSLARLIMTLHGEGGFDHETTVSTADIDSLTVWNRATFKNWLRPIKLADTVSRLIPKVAKLNSADAPAQLNSTTNHDKTRFNVKLSKPRVVGSLRVSVDDFKRIKRSVGRVTYNDIAVSIVGGALRAYLLSKNELPETSLVCGAPVNLRSAGDHSSGNKIATMQIGLATDIDDPVDRLRAVHQYALIGKQRINTVGTGTIMDISDSFTPAALAEGLRALNFASTRIADIPVPFHVMISNVPGPRHSMALANHPLHSLFGFGPIRHTMGLFHVVTQTAQQYSISFVSCRSMLPDPGFYEQCLIDSAEALLAACE